MHTSTLLHYRLGHSCPQSETMAPSLSFFRSLFKCHSHSFVWLNPIWIPNLFKDSFTLFSTHIAIWDITHFINFFILSPSADFKGQDGWDFCQFCLNDATSAHENQPMKLWRVVCMVHSVSNGPNSKPCTLCFTKHTSTGKWKHALLTGKEFFIVRSSSRCSEPTISLLLLPNKPASLPSYHTTDSLIPIGHPSRNNSGMAQSQQTKDKLPFVIHMYSDSGVIKNCKLSKKKMSPFLTIFHLQNPREFQLGARPTSSSARNAHVPWVPWTIKG